MDPAGGGAGPPPAKKIELAIWSRPARDRYTRARRRATVVGVQRSSTPASVKKKRICGPPPQGCLKPAATFAGTPAARRCSCCRRLQASAVRCGPATNALHARRPPHVEARCELRPPPPPMRYGQPSAARLCGTGPSRPGREPRWRMSLRAWPLLTPACAQAHSNAAAAPPQESEQRRRISNVMARSRRSVAALSPRARFAGAAKALFDKSPFRRGFGGRRGGQKKKAVCVRARKSERESLLERCKPMV